MSWRDWYDNLWKPSWTPEPATIGLIWQILYPIIIVTFGFVFVQAFRRKIPWMAVLPFAINLVANLIFTPIQFGLRNLPLAAVDILLVWATIIWMMAAIWPHYRWVAAASAIFYLGLYCDRAATEHHLDELVMETANQNTLLGILVRGFAVWLVIIFAEILHGIARGLILVPLVGEFRSSQIGVFTGSLIILAVALVFVKWLGASRKSELLLVGLLWLILTLAFEVIFGRFVMGASWERLAADYNIPKGGLLPFGMIFLGLSPLITAKVRGIV